MATNQNVTTRCLSGLDKKPDAQNVRAVRAKEKKERKKNEKKLEKQRQGLYSMSTMSTNQNFVHHIVWIGAKNRIIMHKERQHPRC